MTSYLVAGSRPWNRPIFDRLLRSQPGSWHFVGTRAELTDALEEGDWRFVFFLHWSWKVPDADVERFECVNFHMTDLPFGRGGSPLQNLLASGHDHTRLSALRMTSELDAGPIYAKRDLCLRGTAEEIYVRATEIAAEMIIDIVASEPTPTPQTGEVVDFERRTPADSALPTDVSLTALHDFIRMLDAEGYPHAHLDYGGYRFRFTRSALYGGRLRADVEITRESEEG